MKWESKDKNRSYIWHDLLIDDKLFGYVRETRREMLLDGEHRFTAITNDYHPEFTHDIRYNNLEDAKGALLALLVTQKLEGT